MSISPFRPIIIFCLLCAAYIMVSFQRLCMGIIAPDIAASLAIGSVALGWLGSGFHYSYALFQIPGGYIIDRYGPRIPLVFFFGLAGGLGSLLFASASDFSMSLTARLLTGAGMSIVTASSFKTISMLFSGGHYMRFVSIFMATGGLGMLLSATPLALLNAACGWQNILYTVGLLGLALGAAFHFLLKGMAPSSVRKQQPGNFAFTNLVKELFATKGFLVVLLWYVSTSSIFFSFASLWAGPYYMTVFGLSPERTGSLLSVGILGLIIGTPGGAWLSERLGASKPVLRLSSLLAVAGSLMLCLPGDGSFMFIAGLSFVLVCLSGNVGASVIYALLKDAVPAHLVGLSTAVMSSSLFVLTAILQMAIGYLLDIFPSSTGSMPYDKAFLCYLFLAVTSLLLSFRLRDTVTAEN